MDTYLYGLLGLSLAANAFSAISTLVANSKQRDEENQRTISNIYDEIIRKIESMEAGIHGRIASEIDEINKTMSENFEHTANLLDSLEEEVYNYRPYDLDDADKVTCCKTKKRN